MFDIGWSELVLIAIVALIVVGPKELPGLFRTVGQYAGKARGMAREFQRSMEQAANESGLKEATDGLKSVDRLNLNSARNSARKFAENSIRNKPEDDSKSAGGSGATPAPSGSGASSDAKPVAATSTSATPAAATPDATTSSAATATGTEDK